MVTTIAPSPASAQINCFDRNAYSDPKRSRAMTADAENTITSPTNTSSMVTVNSQRSTLTRVAMGPSFHHGGAEARARKLRIVDFRVLTVLVRAAGVALGPGMRGVAKNLYIPARWHRPPRPK